MRLFYIFSVNPYIMNLTRDEPYPLFQSFQKIKNLNNNDLSLGINIYEQIAIPMEKGKFNKQVYKYYFESDFYTMYQNKHTYINKYRDEKSFLFINNSCLRLETNKEKPEFFKLLSKNKNLFVCDFENKDYFWLSDLVMKN